MKGAGPSGLADKVLSAPKDTYDRFQKIPGTSACRLILSDPHGKVFS
jgi:hypothetical protein